MSNLSMKGGRAGWGDEGERPGRFGLFFIGIWTLFLLQPLSEGWQHRDTVRGLVGIVATLLFGAWYLSVFARRRVQLRGGAVRAQLRAGSLGIVVALALAIVVCVSVGQAGTATAVYLSVLCAMTLPSPWAIPLALANAAAFYLAGFVVPGWDQDPGLLLSMLAATLAVWGIQQMLVRNVQLSVANDENRRLAISDERNRFARDLHDILGHSLTVITVKAELAQKLLDVDPQRAKAEVADLERLSRDALSDVRRAVEGYRELTLPG
ncbi:MAG: histidine kinase dimerization/phosphoacceptor domain-containing protein, partial [Marmoricola sp.]